jgi:hypothetical protein
MIPRLSPADLRQAAVLNHELYGFYGVSVWVANITFPRELLESTKLVKFERYAEFTWLAWPRAGSSCGLPDSGRITMWCTKAMTWKAWSRG